MPISWVYYLPAKRLLVGVKTVRDLRVEGTSEFTELDLFRERTGEVVLEGLTRLTACVAPVSRFREETVTAR